ncbi:glycosyl hydrolase [Caldanaerobius polysaccharolyticus]|uniref:glycosyl hydrolase n=1 Tax=Caldanaerobius polysaccharolyticus TaxID=44256 RepID=UPI0012EC7B51|nr:glycosyl hydrolase [Caldanaerobius polysaccharolyticus]
MNSRKMLINYGYKPFWFWNGDMDDSEIKRQVREMADKGVGGFFIHPRQGLTIPYLSSEWFYKVSVAVEEAKKENLEVWLYDEYPYPSGAAGGVVMLNHPEVTAKELKVKVLEITGPDTVELELGWGRVISAGAYPMVGGKVDFSAKIDLSESIGIVRREDIFQMSGLTAYNRKRYFAGDCSNKLVWKVPPGSYKLYVFTEEVIHNFKYYDTFIDPLNRDAVVYFIQETHERYKKYLGDEFGKTIKGIFSDEIGLIGKYPWSPVLPDIFYKNYGYSLVDVLPVLVDGRGEHADKVRFDYWNTVVNTFIQNYDVQIQRWCHDNNLLYVAEKPILRSSQLKYIDIPGIDTGHLKAGCKPDLANSNYRANAKLVSSAAHFYGKERALCECFHSIGWGMTIQDMKWTYDWLGFQGINFFVPHAFFYTTDSLKKHDAPPSSFYQMPWWKHGAALSNYVKALGKLIGDAKRVVRILLVDPVTSQWTASADKGDTKERLKEDFSKLQNVLMDNFYDFYIIDPQLLAEGDVKDGEILINEDKFDVIILPPMLNLEEEAVKKILEYTEQRGILITAGCMPIEKVGNMNDLDKRFSAMVGFEAKKIYDSYVLGQEKVPDILERGTVYFVKDVEKVPSVLEKIVERDIEITSDGQIIREIKALHLLYRGEDCYFVINTSDKKIKAGVSVRNERYSTPGVWEFDIGFEKFIQLKCDEKGGVIRYNVEMSPFESKLFVLKEGAQQSSAEFAKECVKRNVKVIDIDEMWEVEVKSENALLMNKWDMYIEKVEGQELRCGPFNVGCMPIIDQIGMCRARLPIYTSEAFGCPSKLRFPSLEVMYKHRFKLEKDVKLFLVMEPGSIMGQWEIGVNGNAIRPQDFNKAFFYLPTNMAADITSCVRKGINEITVKVKTQKTSDGLVNPLYIFGDFGVFKLDDLFVLKDAQPQGKIGDLKACGIPFYAGDVVYRKGVELSAGELSNMVICIEDERFQASASLYINGHWAGAKSWHPYIWDVNKSWLKEGKNTVELVVTTTLLGLFEGQYFDYDKNAYCDIF